MTYNMFFISISTHPCAYNDAKRHYTKLFSTALLTPVPVSHGVSVLQCF